MSKQIILVVGAGQDTQFIQKAIKNLSNQGFEVSVKDAEETQLSNKQEILEHDICRLSEALAQKQQELADFTAYKPTQAELDAVADRIAKAIEDERLMEEAVQRLDELDAAVHDVHTEAQNTLEQSGAGSKATMNDHANFIVQELGKALNNNVYSDGAYRHMTNVASMALVLMQRMRTGDVACRFYETTRSQRTQNQEV